MRWKPLFAVLLGLLMVGVTAGSAAAAPIHNQPKPQGRIGLGSIIDTKFVGPGVVYTRDMPIYIPEFERNMVLQVVRHEAKANFTVRVYRIPLMGYDVLIFFPDHLTVYPNKAKGMEYKGRVHGAYHFKKGGWFVWKVNLKLPVKFTSGKGWHTVVTFGGSSGALLGPILGAITQGDKPKVAKAVANLIKGQITRSNVLTVVAFALASGANVDLLAYKEE